MKIIRLRNYSILFILSLSNVKNYTKIIYLLFSYFFHLSLYILRRDRHKIFLKKKKEKKGSLIKKNPLLFYLVFHRHKFPINSNKSKCFENFTFARKERKKERKRNGRKNDTNLKKKNRNDRSSSIYQPSTYLPSFHPQHAAERAERAPIEPPITEPFGSH